MAFSTTSELAQFVERELGHDLTGASSQRTDIVSHLDRAHKVVLTGGGYLNYDERGIKRSEDIIFSFARSSNPKILNTVAPIEPTSTTVAATQGSTTITFSADPNSGTSISGYHIRIGSDSEVYRITAHTAAATTATIDAAYVNSNVSGASFKVFKLQYSVGSSDILKIVGPLRCYSDDNLSDNNVVDLFDRNELLSQYPLSSVEKGFPQAACLLLESSGTITIQFSSYSDSIDRFELDYIPLPSTLDTSSVNPIIPAHYRLVLAHMVCYTMLLRNDDSRAAEHLRIARQMFQELVDWNNNMFSTGDTNYGQILSVAHTGYRRKRIKFQNSGMI